jgi:hypothetical protein
VSLSWPRFRRSSLPLLACARGVECSIIFGRAIKNEYLALGTLFTTLGVSLAAAGGKKDAAVPKSAHATASKVDSSSKCVWLLLVSFSRALLTACVQGGG